MELPDNLKQIKKICEYLIPSTEAQKTFVLMDAEAVPIFKKIIDGGVVIDNIIFQLSLENKKWIIADHLLDYIPHCTPEKDSPGPP